MTSVIASASLWETLRDHLDHDGRRAYAGVPADEPELLDAAASRNDEVIVTRDQRLAAFAACGWAMITGRAAVLAVQAGPSFENARTGILETMSLRTPLIVVATANRTDARGRRGFQELDVTRSSPELFVWQYHVSDAAHLEWAVRTAVRVSEGTRSGPVLLSIDPDLHPVPADAGAIPPPRPLSSVHPSDAAIAEVSAVCSAAAHPVIILGAGAKRAGRRDALVNLADALDARVLVTGSGRGAFPESSARFAGLAGLYATDAGREALRRADVILALGTQLEETAREGIPGTATIVQVDIDATILERSVLPVLGVVGDCAETVDALNGVLAPPRARSGLRRAASVARADGASIPTAPLFWTLLSQTVASVDARGLWTICQENGLGDLWGYDADTFVLPEGWGIIGPGEQTAMGFGLGASIGAAAAGARVVAVCGDGALEQNLSWVLTATERNAEIVLFVLRNRRFGWPSLSRPSSDVTTLLPSTRDLVSFAESSGARVWRARSVDELSSALAEATLAQGTRLVEVDVSDLEMIPGVKAVMGPSK
ncbi:MAG: thiamine pyrophosphate-binding protein [Microbacterium sp.]